MWEKDSNSFCLVVYSTIRNKDNIDNNLQEVEVENGKYFRYILFKNTLLEIKISSLYINNVNNVEVQYELLENAIIEDMVSHYRK